MKNIFKLSKQIIIFLALCTVIFLAVYGVVKFLF